MSRKSSHNSTLLDNSLAAQLRNQLDSSDQICWDTGIPVTDAQKLAENRLFGKKSRWQEATAERYD